MHCPTSSPKQHHTAYRMIRCQPCLCLLMVSKRECDSSFILGQDQNAIMPYCVQIAYVGGYGMLGRHNIGVD